VPSSARSLTGRFSSVALAILGLGCSGSTPAPSPAAQGGAAGSPFTSGGTTSGATTSAAGVGGGASSAAGGASGAGPSTGGAAAGGSSAGATAVGGASAGGSGNSGGSGAADYCKARDGLTLCETFEAQAPGAAQAKPPWAPAINGDGQVVIDDTVAHGGSRSLKVHGSGFSSFLVLSGASVSPPAGRLHVRWFMRMAEAMTGGHNTFLVADTAAAPGAGNAFRLGEMNAMLMYTVSGDTHGALANQNYYTDNLPGAALQPLTWACLEVALDHGKPEIQVWLDGKEIADLHHTDWALDSYDTLRFGFEKYAGPVADVWYDDIAVGTGPLGCN
jgi:hypothetical protein